MTGPTDGWAETSYERHVAPYDLMVALNEDNEWEWSVFNPRGATIAEGTCTHLGDAMAQCLQAAKDLTP